MSHDELEFKSRRSEVYDQMEEKGRQSDMETGANYSYTERNPNLTHLRKSPTRLVNLRQSMSPSRGNHTDSEILNSPTQVLYATISADKHKHGGNMKNQHMRAFCLTFDIVKNLQEHTHFMHACIHM